MFVVEPVSPTNCRPSIVPPMLPKLMAVWGGAPAPVGGVNCVHGDEGEGVDDGEADGEIELETV